jgi:hypothetical protein
MLLTAEEFEQLQEEHGFQDEGEEDKQQEGGGQRRPAVSPCCYAAPAVLRRRW